MGGRATRRLIDVDGGGFTVVDCGDKKEYQFFIRMCGAGLSVFLCGTGDSSSLLDTMHAPGGAGGRGAWHKASKSAFRWRLWLFPPVDRALDFQGQVNLGEKDNGGGRRERTRGAQCAASIRGHMRASRLDAATRARPGRELGTWAGRCSRTHPTAHLVES